VTIEVGGTAPNVAGAPTGAHALVFYKVTCPTCQMAAPAFERMASAYGGSLLGVGQDPADRLLAFGREFGMSFPSEPDLAPYPTSEAYGIEHVPTVVVVDASRTVVAVVESWDRAGLNRASATLANLLGTEPVAASDPGDGLPEFRPG
jgi:thiol-disulfide isomerase/thioredoxin